MKTDIDRILIEFFNAFMLKRIGFKILKSAFYLWTINNLSQLERLKGIWL